MLAGVYKQHKLDAYNYRLEINKNLYETREELYKAFETVDGQKNDLQKKSEQVKALERRIEKLEADLQAKREQQSLIAKIVSPKAYAESNCVYGYTTSNYALNQLIAHESGAKGSCATNANGCFGLLQACPGEPLRTACGGDPTCQIQWFIDNKTGGRSWEQIWALWQRQGWW